MNVFAGFFRKFSEQLFHGTTIEEIRKQQGNNKEIILLILPFTVPKKLENNK